MFSPSTRTMASVSSLTMSCFCDPEKTPSMTLTLINGILRSPFELFGYNASRSRGLNELECSMIPCDIAPLTLVLRGLSRNLFLNDPEVVREVRPPRIVLSQRDCLRLALMYLAAEHAGIVDAEVHSSEFGCRNSLN